MNPIDTFPPAEYTTLMSRKYPHLSRGEVRLITLLNHTPSGEWTRYAPQAARSARLLRLRGWVELDEAKCLMRRLDPPAQPADWT